MAELRGDIGRTLLYVIAVDLCEACGDADGETARRELNRLLGRYFRSGLAGLADRR